MLHLGRNFPKNKNIFLNEKIFFTDLFFKCRLVEQEVGNLYASTY